MTRLALANGLMLALQTIRSHKLRAFLTVLGVIVGYLAYRYITHNPIRPPHLGSNAVFWLPPLLLIVALAGSMMLASASHTSSSLMRPSLNDCASFAAE